MEKSQNKSNILIVILIILNLIGLLIIGFLLYEINNMNNNDIIENGSYNIAKNNEAIDNKNNTLVSGNQDNNVVKRDDNNTSTNNTENPDNSNANNTENPDKVNQSTITDWELTLVNCNNSLPENFEVKLSSIDKTRKFDSRAIKYLNDMLLGMKAQNVKGAWIQSSYRSVADQTRVFNEEVSKQMKLRKIKRRGRKGNFKDN